MSSDLVLAPRMAYAAFGECGCIQAVCLDDPEYRKDTAKTVGRWIRQGRVVSRISLAEADKALSERLPRLGPCVHELATS